jgi:hypothetical protein
MQTYNSTYDTKPSNTYNSSYDIQLNHNTTAEIITAVNNSKPYNLTAWVSFYINNATERTLFTNTYNSSYEYWLNLTLMQTYNASYDIQLNHNTTTEIKNAINGSTNSYNITSWVSFYINNATERTLFTNTYNSTYDTVVTGNTSAQMINAVNNSLSYNITSWVANYINNSTERTLFTNTYNSTYDTKPSNTYNSTYDLNINTANTSAEMRAAINGSTYSYNITSWVSNYINNATERTLFTNVFNSSYEYWLNTTLMQTYNSTYDLNINTANTTAEMRTAINGSTNSYNITAWVSFYINNSTERTLFTNVYNSSYEYWLNLTLMQTYNSTYDTKPSNTYNSTYDTYNYRTNTTLTQTYNSSYEYWLNTTLMQTYNSTYDTKPTNTYNVSYDSGVGHNTTAEIQKVVNTTSYSTFNATKLYLTNSVTTGVICGPANCTANITYNSTNWIIYG